MPETLQEAAQEATELLTGVGVNEAPIVKAWAAVKAKAEHHSDCWRLYDGDHDLVWTDSRLSAVFKGAEWTKFVENWCAVVVDAVLDRMRIARVTTATKEATAALGALWKHMRLSAVADEVHLDMLVSGEGFLLAGTDEFGAPEFYWNDARRCHAAYDAERPQVLEWAAKFWRDDLAGVWRAILYYPDRFERYAARSAQAPESGKAFELEGVEENLLGALPVFHFRRERRAIRSELENVVAPQAMINKLTADMMVAAEFQAYPQRYVISQAAQTLGLKNAPNLIWEVPGGDGMGQTTEVGQLPAADLGNFIQAIDRAARSMAAISHTPKFVFEASGDVPSGESLHALEAPLVKKVQRYAERIEPTWAQALAFAALLAGIAVDPATLDLVWADAATQSLQTEAAIVEGFTRAGVPLATALRRVGWSDAEIDQANADKEQQAALGAQLADAYMLAAGRRFDAPQEEDEIA